VEKIPMILQEISERKNVKILFACETGSRAWGFPSPDSDYDIRLIYRHERNWYLSLSQHKDTIEHMDGDLDVTGWDLRKCLTLLKKSNVPLIERFQSPIIYFEDTGFKESMTDLIRHYYSPTAVFFHHYSLAVKFRKEIGEKEQARLKSYFYMIRSLLSCHWIIKDKTVLPMNIHGLMKLIEPEAKERIQSLIELKAGVDEKYLHPSNKYLNQWTMNMFNYVELNKEDLGVSDADYSLLNNYFLKKINEC
jgi:predicted nucleotidyltransferase